MKTKIALFIVSLYQTCFYGLASAQTPSSEPTIPSMPAPTVTLSRVGTPHGVVTTIQQFGGWLLMAAGALAVVMIMVGGIRYMVSAGNSTQTEGAKKTVIYAISGLAIVILSAFIVRLITSFLK